MARTSRTLADGLLSSADAHGDTNSRDNDGGATPIDVRGGAQYHWSNVGAFFTWFSMNAPGEYQSGDKASHMSRRLHSLGASSSSKGVSQVHHPLNMRAGLYLPSHGAPAYNYTNPNFMLGRQRRAGHDRAMREALQHGCPHSGGPSASATLRSSTDRITRYSGHCPRSHDMHSRVILRYGVPHDENASTASRENSIQPVFGTDRIFVSRVPSQRLSHIGGCFPQVPGVPDRGPRVGGRMVSQYMCQTDAGGRNDDCLCATRAELVQLAPDDLGRVLVGVRGV
ncbi:hypothetical protein B0H10DRAFT_2220014 [Mycena sp. CBHHK59/15]|nr:hypothetical protein B0H10DRAFT_2220014 [Mycena sp. CBHHK59/15]